MVETQTPTNLLMQYWYVPLIAIALVVLFLFLMKKKDKQREYYSEIERHKKIINMEMEFNPSEYSYAVYKRPNGDYLIVGKILGAYTDNFDIKELKIPYEKKKNERLKEAKDLIDDILAKNQNVKMSIQDGEIIIDDQAIVTTQKQEVKEATFKIVTFSLRNKCFVFPILRFIKIWHGDPVIWRLLKDEFTFDNIKGYVVMNNDVDLKYKDGVFVTSNNPIMNIFTQSEIYRTLHDHTVDAMGWQMKRFAEIKDENAQMINLKEKDAEIEERKRKSALEKTY